MQMPIVGSGTREDAGTESRAGHLWPRLGPAGRRIRNLLLIVAGIPSAALGAGFLYFLWCVPSSEIALADKADGIVVLTGGASRVTDALELLASKRGQRLLITGVHRATGPVEIARVAPEFQALFSCCVDLDRSAVNTTGNATETRRWVKERGFQSLIVVTSNYHMPRAMAELSHQLPQVALIPFPVVVGRPHETWWQSLAASKLLVFEYLKYVVASARMRFDPPAGRA
jgi:uncharacterized SAM-binding protein YcdF (DUF218 family)